MTKSQVMKKVFLILLLVAVSLVGYSQTQLSTVRGKTKDGKKVKVEYYKGNVEDVIQTITYDLVDELQAKTKKLQDELDEVKKKGGGSDDAEVKRLRKKTLKYENDIKELNTQIDDLKARLAQHGEFDAGSQAQYQDTIAAKDKLISDLNEVVNACNAKIKDLTQEINVLRGLALPPSSPVIGVEFGMGPALIGKSAPEPWAKEVNWAKQVAVYFGTASFSPTFPVSVEAGVGIHAFKMSASLAEYSVMVAGPDNDQDNANAMYSFENLSESLSLTYLNIPVRICFGIPLKDRVTVYGKLGLTPSLKIGADFTGSGTYDLMGYYPQWDVTLEDITELGYGEDLECYKDYEPELKPFVLWANVALGAYVPFKGSPVAMSAGLKLDFPLGSFGTAAEGDFIPGTHAAVLSNGGKAVIPSFELGLIYNLK